MWDESKIIDGFKQFKEKYRRFPTAPEIDKFAALPSSRQIQRRWGGLKKFREQFGLGQITFGAGKPRSKLAKTINKRGLNLEKQLEQVLYEKFGKVCVHSEKRFGPGKQRVDFFIYAENESFGVDIFYPSSRHDLVKCINHKEKKYDVAEFTVYLVSSNPKMDQELINNYIANKRKLLPKNLVVMSAESFAKKIKKSTSLTGLKHG